MSKYVKSIDDQDIVLDGLNISRTFLHGHLCKYKRDIKSGNISELDLHYYNQIKNGVLDKVELALEQFTVNE